MMTIDNKNSEINERVLNEGNSYILDDDFISESFKNEYSNIPGFKQTTNFRPNYSSGFGSESKEKKKRLIGKFFSNMSRFGMNFDDQIIQNMRAVPADQKLLPKEDQILVNGLYSGLNSSWKVKQNADQNFFQKDGKLKRDSLRKLAMQPELEDILDVMTNECIVYDAKATYFAHPFIEQNELDMLKPELRTEITEKLTTCFKRFYKMLNWKYRAWDDFKTFLVEGIMSWEIVWDNLEKPTKIIGLIPLDPLTLTKKYENNKIYWYQFSGVIGKERKLLDAQVIYISYQETNCLTRISYLERLIRPYNIYRIIEQAQLIWTIMNSSYKMKFTIPIKNMGKAAGKQTLMQAMNSYKEDIKFISDSGELKINGQVNMPFMKEYWLPESDSGTPNIETVSSDGPDLNDNDQLKYFRNQLYKISKIPLSRFDADNSESWFGSDATSYARTEIDFGRFVSRLRNSFIQIIIKPMQLQLACDIPELQDMKEILNAISMEYSSYNVFEELMEMDLMQKRTQFIQEMKDALVDFDSNGNEIKYFSNKFLVQKYLHMSDGDIALNKKLKEEEIEELNLAGSEENMEEIMK